jgi:hypothetical protein
MFELDEIDEGSVPRRRQVVAFTLFREFRSFRSFRVYQLDCWP